MLEYALTAYLCADSTLVSFFASSSSIYVTQPPTSGIMPWLVILPMGGTRTQICKTKIEDVNTVRIYVDFPATQVDMLKGRNAIERAKYLLEHYRGNVGTSTTPSHIAYDTYITCSAIDDLAGSSGTYRYQFTAKIKSIETYVSPV